MKKYVMGLVAISTLVVSNAQAEILANLATDLNPANLVQDVFKDALLKVTLPATEAALKKVEHEAMDKIPGLEKKVLVEGVHRFLAVLGYHVATKQAAPNAADVKNASKAAIVGLIVHLAKQGYGKVLAVLHDEGANQSNPTENLSPVHSMVFNAGVGSVVRTLLDEHVPFLK